MDKKIQVILFSGFLGAGKTSLLSRLLPDLARGRKTALLINDFGALSLDGDFLKKRGIPTREIAGGSIFCVCKQANLVQQLTEIAKDIRPDLLIMEASGLAEPSDTAALLQGTFLRETYALPQVITVLDALNYPKLSTILPVLDMQVKIADVVVVSKIDLADPAPTEAKLKSLKPDVQILLSDNEKLYGELVLAAPHVVTPEASLRLCATATPGFSVMNWSGKGASEEAVNALLDQYRDTLLRAKGVLGKRKLELVNGRYTWEDYQSKLPDNLFFAFRGEVPPDFKLRLKKLEK